MDENIRNYFSELGKKGGSVKSDKKTKSCRENARKGRDAIQKRILLEAKE